MKSVDVIIPTFNRGKVLARTLPSFCQPCVQRVFVIDDGSADDTFEVVSRIASEFPKIVYRRYDGRGRQMGAKNLGIKLASADYIYFGDDDSVLANGSLDAMLSMFSGAKSARLIVGARHLYLGENQSLEEVLRSRLNCANASVDQVFDRGTLRLDLGSAVPTGARLPFCQACFMIGSAFAKDFQFDERYVGTCFREESDFVISVLKSGAELVICNEALQVNLPRSLTVGGGTQATRPMFRHVSEIANEFRFFQKHGDYLREYTTLNCSHFWAIWRLAFGKLARLISSSRHG